MGVSLTVVCPHLSYKKSFSRRRDKSYAPLPSRRRRQLSSRWGILKVDSSVDLQILLFGLRIPRDSSARDERSHDLSWIASWGRRFVLLRYKCVYVWESRVHVFVTTPPPSRPPDGEKKKLSGKMQRIYSGLDLISWKSGIAKRSLLFPSGSTLYTVFTKSLCNFKL